MPFVKNSDEAKANMERVRNAKQHKKQLSLSPILKDVKVESRKMIRNLKN